MITSAKKKKYTDFESAIQRLEEITAQLEVGDASLEESINLYTEGLEIAKFCEDKLAEAQKKIKIIREKDGVAVEENFEEEKGDN